MEYKLGNILTLSGRKGKIIYVYKPLGTYSMFTVNFLDDESFRDFAIHELVLASSSTPVEEDDLFFFFFFLTFQVS